MSGKTYSNVVGFDDAPHRHGQRRPVPVVGAVYAGHRLDGILIGRVQRDGADAARRLAALVEGSKFAAHLQLVMLQGIALAGFNVVDVEWLHQRLALPVLVVARRQPDLDAVREALLTRVRGGRRKWRLIKRLGPMEPVAEVYVQRMGISRAGARQVVRRFAFHGHIPEPLRTAHLVAGALETGVSRGRV